MINKEEIKIKLIKIFQDVFDNDNLEIEERTSAIDIAEWDSLTNIQLMLSIQKQFNIKFKIEEMMKQKNVGTLIDIIYDKKRE